MQHIQLLVAMSIMLNKKKKHYKGKKNFFKKQAKTNRCVLS